tara:strand:+ start:292 stop:399 length:108 start_codon:yes stop_codon:yes gene_type:complete
MSEDMKEHRNTYLKKLSDLFEDQRAVLENGLDRPT